MARAIWKGTIRFGPVSVPVPATHNALTAGVLGLLFLSAGCATESGQASEVTRTMTSMHTTRQELAKVRERVDEVLGAMDRLRAASPGSLPWVYQVFTGQVSQTVRQCGITRRRTSGMLAQWRQYTASWEREIGRLSTPELRAAAAERRRTVLHSYERLRDAAGATEQAYPPFLTQLHDIRESLSLDLTPAGVGVVEPAFEQAHQSGAELKEAITALIEQIDRVTAVSPPRK